ncbi:MAG: hypothetical protein EA413_06955 [Cyanobium sp. PLM2.Bin73]|nr:MAG: hypothetical protein EA413_06955 [Cyanobium sp. PLM2.Bin73]
MRIGVIAQAPGGPLTSSAWIRLLLPLQRLERQGLCQLHTLPPLADPASPVELPESLDRLIVQRNACPALPQAAALVAACRQRRIPLVFDLDDALFALPADHPERQQYAPALPALDHLLAEVDLRVFSTPTLARLCQERASLHGYRAGPQTLLANGLDLELWGECRGFPRRSGEEPLRLLYVGTTTHQADLDLVLPELDRLAGRQPGSFQLTVVGGAPSLTPRPWLQVRKVPLSCRRYPHFVRWLQRLPRHDLGLAPLVANPFNGAKSNLKLLDYAALGLGCLCSPGPAYEAAIVADLALAAEPWQWGERLRWAAAHRPQLRRLAQAAHRELRSIHNSAVMASGWRAILEGATVQV